MGSSFGGRMAALRTMAWRPALPTPARTSSPLARVTPQRSARVGTWSPPAARLPAAVGCAPPRPLWPRVCGYVSQTRFPFFCVETQKQNCWARWEFC